LTRKSNNRHRGIDTTDNDPDRDELKILNEFLKRITNNKGGNNHMDFYHEFCYRLYAISYFLNELESDMVTEIIECEGRERKKKNEVFCDDGS
jgi:hypothetical protein